MASDQNNKRSSFKEIVSKPLLRTDSRGWQYSGLGIQLVFTVVVFFFIGYWLDGVFDTKPILMLVFTLLGFIGAFYSFFLTIRRLWKEEEEERRKGKES